jgi:long-chain acyl-CoA synthetase
VTGHLWEKSYPPGVSWGAPLPPAQRIEGLIEIAAARWPERRAIDFHGATLTYAALEGLVARVATGLQQLGVGPGVPVGLNLPNTPHYVACFFGVLRAGGCVVNFNPLAAPAELAQQRADAEVELMVTLDTADAYGEIAALQAAGKLRRVVRCRLEDFLPADLASTLAGPCIEAGSALTFAELIDNDGRALQRASAAADEDMAVLQYTGGTSGEPKGAMLTHANLWAAVQARARWRGPAAEQGVDRMLAVLPLCHIFGLSFIMLLSVATGGEMVLHLRFEPGRVLADIAQKKITVFSGVSTMYTALVHHPEIANVDLSSLERCTAGGGALPLDVLERFRALTGLTPQEGYGLTETAPLAALQPAQAPRPGTVGVPAPLTLIEVVDLEAGATPLPAGALGEICISGPQVMKGYWRKPEATAAALRGGRFHTGDVGFIDADGYVTLLGRKEDAIASAGQVIFPRRIEEAIHRHSSVAEVAVIGVPDRDRGQIAKAFVVLKPGAEPLTLAALSAFLTDKLSAAEMPAALEIRGELPKTAIGKLSKKDLLAEELASRRS